MAAPIRNTQSLCKEISLLSQVPSRRRFGTPNPHFFLGSRHPPHASCSPPRSSLLPPIPSLSRSPLASSQSLTASLHVRAVSNIRREHGIPPSSPSRARKTFVLTIAIVGEGRVGGNFPFLFRNVDRQAVLKSFTNNSLEARGGPETFFKIVSKISNQELPALSLLARRTRAW
jgi:hypothetical protein